MHTHPSVKMDLQVQVSGRSKTDYGLKLSPDFCPQGVFLRICSVSLVPKRGRVDSPQLFTQQGFAPLCPCHDFYLDYCHNYYLKVFTRDKDWLFTLFLLLLPFQRANRRLTVNSSSGAHLSLVSGNANRRPVVNV